MSQDETVSVFTLMISEIFNQKVKISSTAKSGDKSEIFETKTVAPFYELVSLFKTQTLPKQSKLHH